MRYGKNFIFLFPHKNHAVRAGFCWWRCCSPGLLPLYIFIVFQRVCPMLFLIFFLSIFLSPKSTIFLLRFFFWFWGDSGCFVAKLLSSLFPFAPEGSSILNSYGDGLHSGCSAGVQLSVIGRGSICAFRLSFVFYSSSIIFCVLYLTSWT